MDRKLPECNNCERWNNEANRMKNKLYCKINCEARQTHEMQIMIAYNRNCGDQSPYEHGSEVIGLSVEEE